MIFAKAVKWIDIVVLCSKATRYIGELSINCKKVSLTFRCIKLKPIRGSNKFRRRFAKWNETRLQTTSIEMIINLGYIWNSTKWNSISYGWSDPVRRNEKLIRGIIKNSRIYLPLWRVSSVKFFWTGLRDRPSEERHDSAVPRYLRFAPCRNILRAPSVRSFQREVSSVLQLRGLSNGGFNSRPILSSPHAIGTTPEPSLSEANCIRYR